MNLMVLATLEEVLGGDLERAIAQVDAGERDAALASLEQIHSKLDAAADLLRSTPTFTPDRDRPIG